MILHSQLDALYLNDGTKMKTFIEIFKQYLNNEVIHGTPCDVGKSLVEILYITKSIC